MKTLMKEFCQRVELGGVMRRAFVATIPAILSMAAYSASAATEQWLGDPGVSATTNWTDAANWTPGVDQTYYNQVQFIGTGTNPNSVVSVNNVLDGTSGVAQMPIWELDYVVTNANYTTLIDPGVTLTLGAGWGSLYVGADALNNSSPAPANAFETTTLTGPGGAFTVGGNIYLGQGSVTPGDTHNVTLDLSGLDTFNDTGGQILVASAGLQRANGTFYLAKTNQITLGDNFQISNQNLSNSMPCAVYLGLVNNIGIGSGDLTVAGTGTTAVGAWMKFNPAFIGGGSVPTAYLYGTQTGGRIANFNICNENGGPNISGNGFCDFTGGNVTMMVSTMQIGEAGDAGADATGVLTLDNGLVDVNDATIGNQASGNGGAGVGVVNLGSDSSIGASATLKVNGTLTLAAVTGTLTAGTAGTININGGALVANVITNGDGDGTIDITNGALTVNGVAGTAADPISKLALTNSVLNLPLLPGTNNIVVTTLTAGGATNIINIISAPAFTSYPVQIPLVKYSGSLGGTGYNFGLGGLPLLYAGHLFNDTANSSIDLVLTAGSGILTWVGNVSDNWDDSTANWSGSGIYADGDFVRFFDGADNNTVNLTTAVSPAGTVISNTAPNYIFTGSGSIAGSGNLLKEGSGTLVIDNSGGNNYSGNTIINGGTIQIGNNDTVGNLPGSVTNNGSLIYARTDNNTVANAISGPGSFVQAGAGSTLALSGPNSFSGNVIVTNGSTLQAGSSTAFGSDGGSLIVANGSTFDADGNGSGKPIIVSGAGVNGSGAITDSGGPIYDNTYGLAPGITLAGDTTFSYPSRWDLASPATLSTGGNAYNLTLNGTSGGYFEWKNLTLDSALANITINAGTLGIVGATTLGNPSSTLTLASGAGITFYNAANNVSVNKQVDFQSGATIAVGGGNDVMSGAMTLESGVCSFVVNGGTSLTLSNNLSGTGDLYVNQGTGTIILAGDSPAYTGTVSLYNGTVALNGVIGGSIASQSGTIVSGTGTASGLVDISGALLPGGANAAGTFNAAGGLTLEGGAVVTNDLSATTGGNNDLIQVTGDLTMNGNAIFINPTAGTLADGTYTLMTYTGNFNGSLGTVATIYNTAYTLALNNVTTTNPKQIQLVVTGTSRSSLLIWNNASGNGQWDVDSSANWSNVTTQASSSQFNTLDSVVLDNSILNSATPTTNINIPSGQTVVPAVITNNSTLNYTISGSGTISGIGGLVKEGSGTLTITSAGNFTGPVAISGGAVYAGNNSLDSVSSITITNHSTLDMGGGVFTGKKPVTVSDAGLNGKGAIYNSYANYPGESLNVTLAGDALFGGTARWDLASGSQIAGPHSLTVDWSADTQNNYYGQWNSVTIGADVTGIVVTNSLSATGAGSSLGMVGMDTAFQNPATFVTVNTNCTLIFYGGSFNGSIHVLSGGSSILQSGPTTFNSPNVILEDGSSWQAYGGSGDQIIASPITLKGNVRFVVGDYNRTYTNVISGSGGLVSDIYNHASIFAATNTYSGPTIIGNGPQVNLTGNGSISDSSLIFFGGNSPTTTHMDVTGRTDGTLTLASGQTLAGIGGINGNLAVSIGAILSPAGTNTTIGITTGSNPVGTLAASGNVTLDGTTIIKLNGSGTNDAVTAGADLVYGGTLNLVNINSTPLAAGNTFQVFNAAAYSGKLAGIVPVTPGEGLAWNTNQLSSGKISVVSAGAVGPVIASPTVSGGNLIFSGTGGTNNGTYYVLTTTNLLAPLANWVPVATNKFDATGAFSVTNALTPGVPQRFYIIKQ